jgi:outer membrane protein
MTPARWHPARAAPTPASLDEAQDSARANPALAQAEKGGHRARRPPAPPSAERLPTWAPLPRRPTRDQFFPDYRADAVVVGIAGAGRSGLVGTAAGSRADAHLDASEARARDAREAMEAAVISAWTGLKAAQRAVEAGKARSAAADEALRSTRLEAKVGAKPAGRAGCHARSLAAEAAAIEAAGPMPAGGWRLNALAGGSPAERINC